MKTHHPLDTRAQKLKEDFNNKKTQESLKKSEAANAARSPVSFMKNKISENFGERAAKEAVKKVFDGKTKATVVEIHKDRHGNSVRKEVEKVLPKMTEDDLIPPAKTAPGGGDSQFDQIWKNENGEFVIVEEKSSQSTQLGYRRATGDKGLDKKVPQGSREYFDSIIKAMESRGGEEARIAREIKVTLAENKVRYVEARGNPRGNKYEGNSLKLFDLHKKNTDPQMEKDK